MSAERNVMVSKINLGEKFALFNEHWRPRVVADLNGQQVKIVKVLGQFPWHHRHGRLFVSPYGPS
jgi:hypothetical protein